MHKVDVLPNENTENGKIRRRLASAKTRAKKQGLPFDLTVEWWTENQPTHCPVLGCELVWDRGWNSYSLDKVDNDLGYTTDNSRIISWRANKIKSDACLTEIEAIYNYMLRSETRALGWVGKYMGS